MSNAEAHDSNPITSLEPQSRGKIGPEMSQAAARWASLSEAVALAFQIHADQLRKGTDIPYLSHLLGVASLVFEHGGSEEDGCAALLHDAIEDGGAQWETVIAQKFGASVAAIVRGCTDADIQPKPPWRARKQAYLDHLAEADGRVLLVSAADKLHNAGAIVSDLQTHGPAMFDRFNAGRDGTLWYYSNLANIFSARLPGPLSRDLQDAVTRMHELASVSGDQSAKGHVSSP